MRSYILRNRAQILEQKFVKILTFSIQVPFWWDIIYGERKKIQISYFFRQYLSQMQRMRMQPFIDTYNCEYLSVVGCVNHIVWSFLDLPVWNFDGSSTGQAEGHNSDTYLFARAIYKDPFRRGNHILVMCDTYKYNMEPTG